MKGNKTIKKAVNAMGGKVSMGLPENHVMACQCRTCRRMRRKTGSVSPGCSGAASSPSVASTKTGSIAPRTVT